MRTVPDERDSNPLRLCFAALITSTLSLVAADTCPVITTQPTNVYTLQCLSATFHVGATGTPPLRFQWYRDGVPIPNATNDTYTAPFAGGHQGNYFAVVEHESCGAVTSLVAQLVALGDLVPPSLKRASVLPDRHHVLLSFWPCPLDAGSISETFKYLFNKGIVVSNAVLQSNTNVLLTTSLLDASTHYTLVISDLQDIGGNLLYPNPTNVCLWTPPLRLSLLYSNNAPGLTWPADGILQRSLTITGVWTDVVVATNYFVLTNGPAGFYRARFPGW